MTMQEVIKEWCINVKESWMGWVNSNADQSSDVTHAVMSEKTHFGSPLTHRGSTLKDQIAASEKPLKEPTWLPSWLTSFGAQSTPAKSGKID